jgi:hypothetical protein
MKIPSMSEPDLICDRIYDAVAEGRHTLRVGNAKPAEEGSTTFFVSFLLTVDAKTYEPLCARSNKQERSIPGVIKRYIKDCFRYCLADAEESEVKDAA